MIGSWKQLADFSEPFMKWLSNDQMRIDYGGVKDNGSLSFKPYYRLVLLGSSQWLIFHHHCYPLTGFATYF